MKHEVKIHLIKQRLGLIIGFSLNILSRLEGLGPNINSIIVLFYFIAFIL